MDRPFSQMTAVVFSGLLFAATQGWSGEQLGKPTSMAPEATVHKGNLTLASINLAHGRKDALNQLLVSRATIENNLGEIAALLRKLDADLVALQEADGPSRWSGGFDHVAWLASRAHYPWHERASHARSWLFDYGTALLSRLPFRNVINHTFAPSPPTMNKGFLLGQIDWQDVHGKPLAVDVVSVHLDFSRPDVRALQVRQMSKILGNRSHPLIILGDFNSDWLSEGSAVRELAERSGLRVYRHDADDLGTYRHGSKRFDWILISAELEFVDYLVLADVVSDHRPVVAEIALRSPDSVNRTHSESGFRIQHKPGGHSPTP
jgi:endonuclease/exonuclease/phosphatase family metal-dependent hydrolase